MTCPRPQAGGRVGPCRAYHARAGPRRGGRRRAGGASAAPARGAPPRRPRGLRPTADGALAARRGWRLLLARPRAQAARRVAGLPLALLVLQDGERGRAFRAARHARGAAAAACAARQLRAGVRGGGAARDGDGGRPGAGRGASARAAARGGRGGGYERRGGGRGGRGAISRAFPPSVLLPCVRAPGVRVRPLGPGVVHVRSPLPRHLRPLWHSLHRPAAASRSLAAAAAAAGEAHANLVIESVERHVCARRLRRRLVDLRRDEAPAEQRTAQQRIDGGGACSDV
mmetsp:Transcript_14659/g.43573  ORF Transcript_14659/g.43573 Transcript_14659/m.43573 type:complete len:285 (-) Transcript_14659:162-1016(-)